MLQTKNICANGIKIQRLALTISIMRESVLYMYGEYSRPYPAKETVSHKHVTLRLITQVKCTDLLKTEIDQQLRCRNLLDCITSF